MNICHITVLVCWYIVDFHFFIFQQRVHQFHPVSPSFAQFHQRIQVADIWAQLDNKVFLETPVKYDTKPIFLKNGFGINVCGGFAQQLRHFHADNYTKCWCYTPVTTGSLAKSIWKMFKMSYYHVLSPWYPLKSASCQFNPINHNMSSNIPWNPMKSSCPQNWNQNKS